MDRNTEIPRRPVYVHRIEAVDWYDRVWGGNREDNSANRHKALEEARKRARECYAIVIIKAKRGRSLTEVARIIGPHPINRPKGEPVKCRPQVPVSHRKRSPKKSLPVKPDPKPVDKPVQLELGQTDDSG